MIDLMIGIYGVVGAVSIFAPPGLLDSKLACIALLLMYSVHPRWRKV